MRYRVSEGGPPRVRANETPMTRRGNRRLPIALAVLCGMVMAGNAQTGARAQEFEVSVLDLSGGTRSVIVALNQSVVVESSVKVSRVDVVAEQIADVRAVSPTELLVTGRNYGQTNVILWDEKDQQYLLNIRVELDVARLNEALRGIDPLSAVEAKSILGNLVLTGTVSSVERAERMVDIANLFLPKAGKRGAATTVQNHLEIAGEQQVLLRCVVAEVSRSAMRELGVNGFLAGENFKDAFVVNQLAGINPINIGAAADALVTQNIPFLTGQDGIPIGPNSTISLGFPRAQMQLFIQAMADNSLASILAEPTLVAISGETASFLAGGEFPVPVPQGNQQVTIEFREFGVRLTFTPVVLGHQRIRLRIAPEVSELDFTTAVQIQGSVIPGLKSRATETTVEVGNGQTLAIAGLLREEVRGLASRVPGIGDVPILGALFRSTKFQRSMSELVILVTPELVAPMDPHQTFPLPTDDRTDPNDFELYFLGLLEGTAQANSTDSSDEWSTEGRLSQAVRSAEPHELSIHGPWGHAGFTDQP